MSIRPVVTSLRSPSTKEKHPKSSVESCQPLGPNFWFPQRGHCRPSSDQFRRNVFKDTESLGIHVHQIAGEAHWQLGRTESHGGWFSRVLDRTMSEFMPTNKEEWETCVTHSHVKNTMIQSSGYTPHQHVFGKNPDTPSDLMSEPRHVIPATLGLSDEAVARSQSNPSSCSSCRPAGSG